MSKKGVSDKVKFQKNVSLKNYTNFRIGGKAKYFFSAKTEEELIETVRIAREMNLPFFILGGGSNLLVSDKGFNGLVVKFGEPLSSYVFKGLEWAVGIPGTVQGAVYGNAGAFGKSMKDDVKTVTVLKIPKSKSESSSKFQIQKYGNKKCCFGYRDSVFKHDKNLIILSVEIKKRKINPKKIKEYLNYRKQRHPQLPSAGSVFKNSPSGTAVGETPAAILIHKAGLTGKKIGGAQVSEKHSNFIVNLGNAKAEDVKKLIHFIKRKVKKQFKIELEEEIQYLGF